jgi:hypothetical protein
VTPIKFNISKGAVVINGADQAIIPPTAKENKKCAGPLGECKLKYWASKSAPSKKATLMRSDAV